MKTTNAQKLIEAAAAATGEKIALRVELFEGRWIAEIVDEEGNAITLENDWNVLAAVESDSLENAIAELDELVGR